MRMRLMNEISAHAEALRTVAPQETEALMWIRREVQDSENLTATIKKYNLGWYVNWIKEV